MLAGRRENVVLVEKFLRHDEEEQETKQFLLE